MTGVSWIPAIAVVAALSAASGGLAPAAAEEAPVRELSRRQAIDEALVHNAGIAAAREQVEQARARVTEAIAFPDPSFVATLEQEESFLKPRTAQTQDYGFAFTLPFPDKFRLRGNVARADLRSAEASLAQLTHQIASQTVTAYDALLVARKHREDLEAAAALAQDFLKRTDARFEAGTVAKFDVIKARVDVAQAQNDLIANERTIAVARAALNRLLGRSQGAPFEPAEALAPPPPPPPVEDLEKLAESSRPELYGLAALQEGARSATTLARQYWLPDFNVMLARNFTYGFPPAFTSSLSFSIPLLFWQHENGEVAEARHRVLELENSYSDERAQVDLDVRTAYAAADTALRQVVFIRDSLLPEAREAYRIASTSYSLGGISALELLDAKRTLLDAERQYADALGAANDARADLELAVGAPLPQAPSGGKDAP